MRNIVVLGSTGSIGRNALQVIRQLNSTTSPKPYKISALVAHTNWKLLLEQVREFKPARAALIDRRAYEEAKKSSKTNTSILCGLAGVREIIMDRRVDVVLSAVSGGTTGLPTSLWAINSGKTLALANKESLVMAGDILMKTAARLGNQIIPVDSEHNAIWQLIRSAGLQANRPNVKHIILTASGGPFYKLPERRLKRITPDQALRHPTWRMGDKITIDSATMMNKALEIIEAHHLFGLPADKIKVLIHPQSIVHGLVELADGATIAHLSKPDMKIPIKYALTSALRCSRAERPPASAGQGIGTLGNNPDIRREVSPLARGRANRTGFNINYAELTFSEPMHCAPMFRTALNLGYEVIRRGGTSGAVLNAANEEAVKLFLKRRIAFTDIVKLTEKVFRKHRVIRKASLADIMASDRWARIKVLAGINKP